MMGQVKNNACRATLGESTEMYLLAVLLLEERSEEATVSLLAGEMGLGMSTVSEKVRRLTEAGLLHHEWREGVGLSRKGRSIAGRVLRRRRLVESFLVNKAGYSPDEAAEEACILEHAVSDRLADAIDMMLGFPETDPQGRRIPSRDGRLEMQNSVPLSDLATGSEGQLYAVTAARQEILQYFNSIGVRPGARCRIQEEAPFEGPLVVSIDGARGVVMSRELASMLHVLKSRDVL